MERHGDRLRAARLPAGFAIEEQAVEPPAVALRVSGELDATTAPLLRRRVDQVLAEGGRALVIDLTEVTFIDSISLAALVAAKRRLGPEGRLAVVADGAFVLLILEATGLDGVLDVFPTFAQARDFVRDG